MKKIIFLTIVVFLTIILRTKIVYAENPWELMDSTSFYFGGGAAVIRIQIQDYSTGQVVANLYNPNIWRYELNHNYNLDFSRYRYRIVGNGGSISLYNGSNYIYQGVSNIDYTIENYNYYDLEVGGSSVTGYLYRQLKENIPPPVTSTIGPNWSLMDSTSFYFGGGAAVIRIQMQNYSTGQIAASLYNPNSWRYELYHTYNLDFSRYRYRIVGNGGSISLYNGGSYIYQGVRNIDYILQNYSYSSLEVGGSSVTGYLYNQRKNHAPSVSVATPLDGFALSNNINISGMAYDYDIGDTLKVKYTIEGTSIVNQTAATLTTNATNQNFSVDIPTTGISAGAYSIKIWAEDSYTDKSSIVTKSINIDKTAPPAPTASPTGGIYNADKSVILSNAENGVIIRYTTNGTDPTTLSTVYSGATTINSTTTLKAKAWDVAGNVSSVMTQTYTIDKTSPSVSIASNPSSSPTNASSITYTFTFSESVIGFTTGDITVTNGTKGTFAGSGTTYTLVVTNTGSCTQTVSVAAGKCTDSAGNNNTAGSKSITIDRTSPTVTITSNPSISPTNASSITYTFTFSENVTGFDVNDVIVTNGTIGTFAGSGSTYTLIVTNTGSCTQTVSVGAGACTDSVGNGNTVGSKSIIIDRTPPAAPIISINPMPVTNGNVTVTIAYPADAAVKSYNIDGGVSKSYTAPFTVSSNCTVNAVGQDAAGNWSTEVSYIIKNIDKTLPDGNIIGNPTNWTKNDATLTLNILGTKSNLKSVILPNGAVQPVLPNPTVIDPSVWTIETSGSQGSFTQNGTTAENQRILGINPWGVEDTLWATLTNDTASGADGGWNNYNNAIDRTKKYRLSVWIKREDVGNGRTYFGTQGNTVCNLSNGAKNSNPYFTNFLISSVPQIQDNWVLLVGFVHPYSYSSTSSDSQSGIYTSDGTKVGSITDFKWASDATIGGHRTYLYYSTSINEKQYWYRPRMEVIDGTEPSLTELLSGNDINKTFDYTVSSNGTYTFTIEDYAGNTKDVSTTVSKIDKTGPTGSIKINNDEAITNYEFATLTLTASDSISSVKEMRIYNGATDTGWITFNSSKQWTLLGGNNTVKVKYRDEAGNESIEYSKTIKYEILPTLNTPNLSNEIYKGFDTVLLAAGTNIGSSTYRIFYTTKISVPTVTDGGDTPGAGWIDSGITGAMNITGTTNVSKTISSSTFDNVDWIYVVFKVAVASGTGNQVIKYTSAYSINDPNDKIGYIGHNQIIKIFESGNEIVVSNPTMPVNQYEPYLQTDINALNYNNTFENEAYAKYRLEFDVIKPSDITKLNIYFDYNLFNKDRIQFIPTEMKLQRLNNNGTITPIQTFTTEIQKEDGMNRYYVSIDKSKVNAAGRYFLEYSGRINVETNYFGVTEQITNYAEIQVIPSGSNFSETIDGSFGNRKVRINTNVTRALIQYQ